MDGKNENKVEVGQVYISLNLKSKAVFYEVKELYQDSSKCTWARLEGIQFEDKTSYPLLHFDKIFAKVNESTVNILFRRREKNGNASKESSNPKGTAKSIRREGERRSVARGPTSLRQNIVKTGKGHRS